MLRNKMLKVMHGWPMRPSVHHFFGFRAPKLPASQRGRRRVPKGCPGAGEAQIRRGKCEDFAPRNEGIRVSGEGGAKRGSRRALRRLRAARLVALRALLRNMYKKRLAFLYTIVYYHTNAIKNTWKKWIRSNSYS